MSSPVRVRMIRIARRLGAFGRCETLRDRRHLVPPPDREPLAREDRAILRLESATVAGHTLKIAILDPSADRARPDVDGLRARIGERIERAPRLRRRLEMRPSGGRTAWVDDPTFDVREHVRAVPVAKQFSNEDLRCFCACMMEERLDRSRPLWTIDVLAPFEGGGVVVVWRLHHALADGATALRLAEEVLWDRPAPPSVRQLRGALACSSRSVRGSPPAGPGGSLAHCDGSSVGPVRPRCSTESSAPPVPWPLPRRR